MSEFKDFLLGPMKVPKALHAETRLIGVLSMKKNSILTRFLVLQMVGALFSLSLCPQFGLGLIDGHGVTHYFRMIGDWACAVFCASVFISSGSLLCYVTMRSEELWWVWKNYKLSFMVLPALLWSLLMLTGWNLRIESEEVSYHLTWVGTGVAALWCWGLFFKKNLNVQEAVL